MGLAIMGDIASTVAAQASAYSRSRDSNSGSCSRWLPAMNIGEKKALHQGVLIVAAQPIAGRDRLSEFQEQAVVVRCARPRHQRLPPGQERFQRHQQQVGRQRQHPLRGRRQRLSAFAAAAGRLRKDIACIERIRRERDRQRGPRKRGGRSPAPEPEVEVEVVAQQVGQHHGQQRCAGRDHGKGGKPPWRAGVWCRAESEPRLQEVIQDDADAVGEHDRNRIVDRRIGGGAGGPRVRAGATVMTPDHRCDDEIEEIPPGRTSGIHARPCATMLDGQPNRRIERRRQRGAGRKQRPQLAGEQEVQVFGPGPELLAHGAQHRLVHGLRQPVDQRQQGVEVDRERTVRRGEKNDLPTRRASAMNARWAARLPTCSSTAEQKTMSNSRSANGRAPGAILTKVSPGKLCSMADASFDAGHRQMLAVGIEFFEKVGFGQAFVRRDAEVEDPRGGGRMEGVEEQLEHPAPRLQRVAVRNAASGCPSEK